MYSSLTSDFYFNHFIIIIIIIITNVETSYFTQLKMCYLMTTFRFAIIINIIISYFSCVVMFWNRTMMLPW